MEFYETIEWILKKHGIWTLIIFILAWTAVYIVKNIQVEYRDGKFSVKYPRSKD